MKARGMGLSLPLAGVSMTLAGGTPPGIRLASTIDEVPDSWQFAQFKPTPRHHLAVAVRRRGRNRAIALRELRAE